MFMLLHHVHLYSIYRAWINFEVFLQCTVSYCGFALNFCNYIKNINNLKFNQKTIAWILDGQCSVTKLGDQSNKWFWMVLHGSECLWMVLHGYEWFWMVLNVSEWFWIWMVLNGSAWFCMVLNGSGWFGMVLNGSEWFWMVLNGSEWL